MSDTAAFPMSAEHFHQRSLVGATIALFQGAETLVNDTMKYKKIYKFLGKRSLNILQAEILRINEQLESRWSIPEGDTYNFLSRDVVDVIMVLAAMDVETRTGYVDAFRRIWGNMNSVLGEADAEAKAEDYIYHIRAGRGLNVPVEDVTEPAEALAEASAEAPAPTANVVIFVRDAETRQFVKGATVHVGMGGQSHAIIKSTDPDTLYEQEMPAGVPLEFRAFLPPYLPAGLVVNLRPNGEELVINLWLSKTA